MILLLYDGVLLLSSLSLSGCLARRINTAIKALLLVNSTPLARYHVFEKR